MGDLRLAFVEGGDPGPAVVAAVTAVLSRPTIVVAAADDDDQADTTPQRSPWVRAARLEAVVPGRRITTRADLAWRR